MLCQSNYMVLFLNKIAFFLFRRNIVNSVEYYGVQRISTLDIFYVKSSIAWHKTQVTTGCIKKILLRYKIFT